MLSFGLSILLFCFWSLLGYAVASPLEPRMPPLRRLLLSPAIGMVVNGLPVFMLNLAGLPVARTAVPVGLALLAGAVFLLWWFRPTFPWRLYRPFAGLLLLALVLIGRPMFQFGFNWVSYCNDDMANYCLGAQRVADYGYFSRPAPEQLTDGKDYVLLMWFLHVPGMHRPGSEMLLAFTSSWTGLSAPEVFMPTILAMHLCLICAAGALSYWNAEMRAPAILTCLLLSVSALATLGTLYQLIAQVAGLALVRTCATLLMRPWDALSRNEVRKSGVLIGIAVAGVFVFYPEVFPFLVLSFALYAGVAVWRKRLAPRRLLAAMGVGAAVVIVLLNFYTLPTFVYLLSQVVHGTTPDDPQYTLFPYYLMPSGLANLWGFQPLATPFPHPWQSVVIAGGLLMLLAATVAAVWLTWRGHPSGPFTLVMLSMGLYLFAHRSGFGLFKLAMYLQPFLLAVLVAAWFAIVRKPMARVVPLLVLGVLGMFSQASYVRSSCGIGATFNEILDPSGSHVYDEFRSLVKQGGPGPYLIDTYNFVLAKFQAMGARGTEVAFPSNRFFQPGGYIFYPGLGGSDVMRATGRLIDAYRRQFVSVPFQLFEQNGSGDVLQFVFNQLSGKIVKTGGEKIVLTTGKQSPFNRRYLGAEAQKNFTARPAGEVSNHLIFIASELGQPYVSGLQIRPNYALYPLESEPLFFPEGRTMAGIGRYLLFQVVHPSEQVRLSLEMTASYKSDGENTLPRHAAAIGRDRNLFGFTGRGAARVISPPLQPQAVMGQSYLAIDMGEEGRRFPGIRRGLMKMFGVDVAIDRRKLVGFGRDISLISEAQYQNLAPPSRLEHFGRDEHNDLLNPDLEFAGIYEDGWVSESSFFKLRPLKVNAMLVVRGYVPGNLDPNFQTEATLRVDGQTIAQKTLAVGEFELAGDYHPPATQSGNARVELSFSRWQLLTAPDNRPAVAHLSSIGFEPRTQTVAHVAPPARDE